MHKLYAWEEQNLIAYLTTVESATPEELKLAAQMFGDSEPDDDIDDIYNEDDDGAHIKVAGPLTQAGPPPIARLLGFSGTSYAGIRAAIDKARASSKDNVTMHFSSPGGEVMGVDQTWQAIRSLGQQKKVTARVEGMCASAAYYLASACDNIAATSPGDEIGSIGVKMVAVVPGPEGQKYEKQVQIISKNAPNKSDDPSEKAGRTSMQSRVDASERVFMSRVAEGRGVSIDTVREKFGRGGLMLAEDPDPGEDDALSVGMIDKVVPFGAQSGPAAPDDMSRKMPGRMPGMNSEADEHTLFAGASGKSDFDIVDKPWDVTAANKRWREKSGSDKEPSASYKDGFFWYDAKDAKNFGAYKLQFVDVVDGKAVAIRRAVFACNGAMSGARGGVQIPGGDKKSVQSRIDGYINKIKKMDDESTKKKGSATADKEKRMTLKEFLEGNPEAQAELGTMIADAKTQARASVYGDSKRVLPIIASAAYPEKVKAIGMKVLAGDATVDSFEMAASMFDMLKEAQATTTVVKEQPDDTPATMVTDDEVLYQKAASLKINIARVQMFVEGWNKDPSHAKEQRDLKATLKAEIEYQEQLVRDMAVIGNGRQ